jgi:DNA-binding NtrC family response regulator
LSDAAAGPLVLLAEDEDLIRMELQSALEDAGFAVIVAGNGAKANYLIGEQGDDIRALVTDIDLGSGPTGWDVAHAAREQNPGLAVVYATSSSQADWAVNGVPKSVLVTKPFASTQVVVAVSELLNSDAQPSSD